MISKGVDALESVTKPFTLLSTAFNAYSIKYAVFAPAISDEVRYIPSLVLSNTA